jgi:hypothetical protein
MRWGVVAAILVAVALPVAVGVGALVSPSAETVNGAGGLFGWAETFAWWETGALALLAAIWAVGKAPRGVGQVICAVGAAMAVVGLSACVQLGVGLADGHDGTLPVRGCGLIEDDVGCHGGTYLRAIGTAVILEIYLAGAMLVGALAYLLGSRLWRRASPTG